MTRDPRSLLLVCLALAALPQLGCGDPDADSTTLADDDPNAVIPPGSSIEQPFTSDVATLLDFDFDGELTSTSGSNIKGQVRAQLMYTVGHFNAEPGVARLDKLVLSNTSAAYIGGGLLPLPLPPRLPAPPGHNTRPPPTASPTPPP